MDDLRRRPVPASVKEIHGEVKTMGEVRLDDGKCGQMTFWTLPTDENRVIGKATEDNHSNGVAILVRSP